MDNKFLISKKILREQYNSCLSKEINSQKNRLQKKYKHSVNVVKIAKKVFNIKKEDGCIYLLHDIGRFLQPNDEANHARSGYLFLENYNEFTEIELIPILLHENDLNWLTELEELKEYGNFDNSEKQKLIQNIKRLKDCDIIENLETTIKRGNKNEFNLDDYVYNCLINNKICSHLPLKGYLNDCLYIICGLYILNYEESLKYLKKKKVVSRFFKKAINKSKDLMTRDKLIRCREYLIEKDYI